MFFFSDNASPELRNEICSLLGVNVSDSPSKYLGLPIHWGRSKISALNFVTNKIRLRLQGW